MSDQVELRAQILKLNPDLQLVYGWASVTSHDGVDVVDKQGDIITVDDLRSAAHEYLSKSRKGGHMHINGRVVGEVVESIIVDDAFRKAMRAPEHGPKGWWIALKVTDPDVWQQVKLGKLAAFSIGGHGVRVPT